MSKPVWILRAVAVLLSFAVLTACAPTFNNHGYTPTDDVLDAIVVGVDTRETVATTIGQPGTAGLLTDSGWYYVSSRFKHYTYHAPEEIDREVLAISFDNRGVVSNIERFGLEDGQVIVLSRRVTDSGISGITFLQQLFGNFGRIDPATLL